MKKEVVVDVWVPDLTFPGWMDRWHQQAAEFEAAHPGCTVRVQGKDFWTFPLEVSKAAAEGRAPALAEYYFYMGQVARDERARDGSPLFTSVEKAIGGRSEILGEPVVIDDVLPVFREYYSLDGDLTSMPSVGTTSLLYANTDLLRAAGVTELPTTWDEVDSVCEAIAALPGGPDHAITWSNHGTFFQQAVAVQGGHLVGQENGRAGRAERSNLASGEMLAWAEWWRRLHGRGHYLYTGSIPDWAGTLRAFTEQRVAVRISSSNDVNYMVRGAKANGFGIEVGIFPYNDKVPYAGNAVAGTSIWLANGLDEATRDAALAFLMFLHSPRMAAERHKANSFVPITHASLELLEREGWFDLHPYHRVAVNHVSRYPSGVPAEQRRANGVPPSVGALFGDFAGNQDVMTRAMGDVLALGADPRTRFAEADAEAQRLLDGYNAYALRGGPRPHTSHFVEYFAAAMAGRDYTAADLEKAVKANR
ncbi:ABC transporter substrate-binding protein [Streptosporangium oxazolinicum]|uniref:ABC transporter substrate-binding protein n=1 Tax=Streptosporangium oxazolinicum TaxID=909287 RepID=A0ABP8B346_9ACTN